MVVNLFGGWLLTPEYFFFWNYHGQNSLFNTMSYQNPAMDKLIDAARFEEDPQKYKEEIEGFWPSPKSRVYRCSIRSSTSRCRTT